MSLQLQFRVWVGFWQLWFVDNRRKSKISYSAVSVSKGTGGIAIFAAKNWKMNMCDVSLTKEIVGIAIFAAKKLKN